MTNIKRLYKCDGYYEDQEFERIHFHLTKNQYILLAFISTSFIIYNSFTYSSFTYSMGTIKSVCCSVQPKPVPRFRIIERQNQNKSYTKLTQTNKHNQDVVNQTQIQQYIQNKPKIKKIVSFDDFRIDGQLGRGGFGLVFLCQLKQNIQKGITQKYAMKRAPKNKIFKKDYYGKDLQQCSKLQKEILATFNCKFIISLIMAFQDDYYVYFVMQCATGGDTFSLIKKNSRKLNEYRLLGENAVRFIAGCVILGLQYLHKNKIMYRDLKPQNVLMFDNGYVKISDLGLAKKSQENQISKSLVGTSFYNAPQMILKLGYKMEIDFWTLGVYLYELSVHQLPFTTDQITLHKFKKIVIDSESNRNWKGANLSLQLKDLINGLLKYNPEVRLGHNGWKQIKQHVFFKDFDWTALQQMKMESPIKNLVNKYPVAITPYKQYMKEQTEQKSQKYKKIEGWTFIKEENK